MISILITGMGSTTAISVAKGLRQQKELPIRIIGVDTNSKIEIAGSSFCDAFYKVPRADDPNYIRAILEIAKAEQIRAIFPIIDLELSVIAAHRDEFINLGIFPWVSHLRAIEVCNDKYRTFEFFKENGINTPESWIPGADLSGLAFPLIVKPRAGVSSIDVFKVDDLQDLNRAIARVKQPIIQEYLEGDEFTIDVLCDNANEVIAVVPRLRIETKAGISTKGRTIYNDHLIEAASRIAKNLKIIGPCNIQCRMKANEASFFEINPRFSGTTPLTIAAGVNGPLIYTKISAGIETLKFYPFRADVYMNRFWSEIFYFENDAN